MDEKHLDGRAHFIKTTSHYLGARWTSLSKLYFGTHGAESVIDHNKVPAVLKAVPD